VPWRASWTTTCAAHQNRRETKTTINDTTDTIDSDDRDETSLQRLLFISWSSKREKSKHTGLA
jgi:hypothetical protein